MTSADSNSQRTYLYRLITVRCKLKKKYFCLCKELLLSADVPPADYYCPRTYLPRTITVRGRTCHGLLLSADVLAADYNSHVQKGGIGPSCRFSTCFLQVLLVLVFTFFKISFEWDTSFKFRLQIWNQHKILHFLIPKLTYLKQKSFKLWTVLLLAANKHDLAYYCPRTQFAEGLLHLQAKVTGLGHARWRGFM